MDQISRTNPTVGNNVPIPAVCDLQSAPLAAMGAISFRRSTTDGVPVLARQLGDRAAETPLHALRRELAIGSDTPDDHMLALIGSALDYVSELHLGDVLPSEICTGEASWPADARHLQIARTRIILNLAAWLTPGSGLAAQGRDVETLLHLSNDPELTDELHALGEQAARQLGMRDGNAMVALVEGFALELAYIEALRERLLLRVAQLTRRLRDLAVCQTPLRDAAETACQIHRLCVTALRQLASRFDDVDAHTGEPCSLLQNADSQRQFIRSNRDWLYRCQRDWTPLLDRWEAEPVAPALLAETYRFLAPKWMPAQRWQNGRQDRRRSQGATRMTW